MLSPSTSDNDFPPLPSYQEVMESDPRTAHKRGNFISISVVHSLSSAQIDALHRMKEALKLKEAEKKQIATDNSILKDYLKGLQEPSVTGSPVSSEEIVFSGF